MSDDIYKKIWDINSLLISSPEKILLLYISQCLENEKQNISILELTEKTCLVRNSVLANIKRLEEKKIISIIKVAGEPNKYTINLDSITPQIKPAKKISKTRRDFNQRKGTLLRAMLENGLQYICNIDGCSKTNDLHIDHKLAIANGGDNSIENLQFLCEKHNLEKSDKLI